MMLAGASRTVTLTPGSSDGCARGGSCPVGVSIPRAEPEAPHQSLLSSEHSNRLILNLEISHTVRLFYRRHATGLEPRRVRGPR